MADDKYESEARARAERILSAARVTVGWAETCLMKLRALYEPIATGTLTLTLDPDEARRLIETIDAALLESKWMHEFLAIADRGFDGPNKPPEHVM